MSTYTKMTITKIIGHDLGLACDIDDSISETLLLWTELFLAELGNPTDLTAQEIKETYGYVQNVPFWDEDKVKTYANKLSIDTSIYSKIAPIKEAQQYLPLVHEIIPISVYLSARPNKVIETSTEWVKKIKEFPNSPMIHRPDHITYQDLNKWKAEILERNYPQIQGIIDDNTDLLDHISENYPGTVFVYNNKKVDHPAAVHCPTWSKIYENCQALFK